MKVIAYQKCLPIEELKSLIDTELETPVAQGRDLLVAVQAISVNPVDTKIRQRITPPNDGLAVLGWDAAGTVIATGEAVQKFQVGDAVWYAGALDRPGCNAEHHLVDERIVAKKPQSLDWEAAAALPLTTLTAWELLFDRLALHANNSDCLLVIGAAGGVGSILIQLAKARTQMTVIATASRPESQQWTRQMGADHCIDHHQPLAPQLQDLGIASIPYIASLTATGEHQQAIADIIAPQGHLGLIDDPSSFDIRLFKQKSVSIHWEFMYTRSLFQTADMQRQQQILKQTAEMIDNGQLTSTQHRSLGCINAANLRHAHAVLESGQSLGKIVLSGFCEQR